MNNDTYLEEDIKVVTGLEILANSNGGKALLGDLQSDIILAITKIVDNRATYSIQEFVAVACDIKTKLDVVRTLTRASNNREYLEKLLKEKI